MKKFQRVFKCNKKAWLIPYIGMKTELRQKAKSNFKKLFFKLMNKVVFGKLWKCEKTYRYQICNNRKEKKLFSKLSDWKVFYRRLINNRNEKNSNTYE